MDEENTGEIKKPILPPEINRPAPRKPAVFESSAEPAQVKGPMFISLEKYKEIENDLLNMDYDVKGLRELLASLKNNRETGVGVLRETTGKLENLEQRVAKIHSLIKE